MGKTSPLRSCIPCSKTPGEVASQKGPQCPEEASPCSKIVRIRDHSAPRSTLHSKVQSSLPEETDYKCAYPESPDPRGVATHRQWRDSVPPFCIPTISRPCPPGQKWNAGRPKRSLKNGRMVKQCLPPPDEGFRNSRKRFPYCFCADSIKRFCDKRYSPGT